MHANPANLLALGLDGLRPAAAMVLALEAHHGAHFSQTHARAGHHRRATSCPLQETL